MKTIIEEYFLFSVFALFVLSILSFRYLIFKVLWVVREKGLYKQFNDRSAHTLPTPILGGVAFFGVFIIMFSLIQSYYSADSFLVISTVLMFMVGLKDDLVISTPKAKFLGELIAALFLILIPGMQLINFYGLFGIYEIPYFIGCLISIFIIIAIINAYNLIDGIDGLAASLGILVVGVYGILFWISGDYFRVLLCTVVAGILIGYLPFNYNKSDNRIFMGDSGSLMIGLIIGYLTLSVVNIDMKEIAHSAFHPANRFALLLAVLFVPFFDTLRIIIIRLQSGKSPFVADKNHIHHLLLRKKLTHFQASNLLILINLFIIILFFILTNYLTPETVMFFILGIYVVSFFLLQWTEKKTKKIFRT